MSESLMSKLNEALKRAMKSGEKSQLEGLRTLKGGLQKLMIDKGQTFGTEDELNFLLAESKRRKEAIELYQKGGRTELAAKEERELEMIAAYLPKQLDQAELAVIVDEVIKSVGGASIKDMGKVMGAVMAKVKGQADGKTVQDLVKSKLGK